MFDKQKIAIKFWIMKRKWKIKNKNNFTYPKHLCDISKIEIGDFTYGGIDAESFGAEKSFLKIGRFCSIAPNVRFILDGEHDYCNLSTYPFKVRLLGVKVEALCKGPILVEDDVWIGERSIILSGVTIGRGAIIGAGSIVTKSVPPYAIFANGKVIKYRFSKEIIECLMKINYEKLTLKKIKKMQELLYTNITYENVNKIIKSLELV